MKIQLIVGRWLSGPGIKRSAGQSLKKAQKKDTLGGWIREEEKVCY